MDKLIKHLNELGYFAVKGEPTVVAFNDAIIEMQIDEEGDMRLKVNQFDHVTHHDDEINDVIDEAFNEEEYYSEFPPEFYEDDEDELINDEDFFMTDDEIAMAVESFMSNCKFKPDDTVTVKGYEGYAFKIIGIAQLYDETIYCLVDIKDEDNYIEAFEEDMVLYNQPQTQAKQLIGGALKGIVDELLDEYNDKMSLYMVFGDSEYYERCKDILKELEKIKL